MSALERKGKAMEAIYILSEDIQEGQTLSPEIENEISALIESGYYIQTIPDTQD